MHDLLGSDVIAQAIDTLYGGTDMQQQLKQAMDSWQTSGLKYDAVKLGLIVLGVGAIAGVCYLIMKH